jgi:CMP-N,N'-diacetyllegionaminic acid synthase
MKKETIIGLIPARSGSKRCQGKNTRLLCGQPLIAWTIRTAKQSGIFSDIVVSTDSQETIEIAESFGVSAILRPAEISQDGSTDYEWVKHAIDTLDCKDDAFGILRPTNPFRSVETICECWHKFQADPTARSLRTVRPIKEHPDKMWLDMGTYLIPITVSSRARHIKCDLPFQLLDPLYIQDGLLYINLLSNLKQHERLTTDPVLGHITEYPENLDINTEDDFELAESVVGKHLDILLKIKNGGLHAD